MNVNSINVKEIAIAFCADRAMEAPLHVAASSLLRNLDPAYRAKFYFLLPGFSLRAFERLKLTLNLTHREHSVKRIDEFDDRVFHGFRPLQGSLTPYLRLLLPDLVEEPRLLYLDADTQVKIDVAPLFRSQMGPAPVGFVVDGTVSSALESKFFLSLGKRPDSPAFNSGVMLFNMLEWRSQQCSKKVMEFGRKHRKSLITADQTALNAVFADTCYRLENIYNIKLHGIIPKELIPATGLRHFAGSPKPWDVGARKRLPFAEEWFLDLDKTALPWNKKIPMLSSSGWLRLGPALRGYRRMAVKNRLSPPQANGSRVAEAAESPAIINLPGGVKEPN